jgi:hypothetical protein
MFNIKARKSATTDYSAALDTYESAYNALEVEVELLNKALTMSCEVLSQTGNFVNSIANTPKEFAATVEKLNAECTYFRSADEFSRKAQRSTIGYGIGGIVGSTAVAVGTQIAKNIVIKSTAPIVAKAAVAGGAKAFASLGVGAVAGTTAKSLAVLIGPIGWGLCGASLVFSGYKMNQANRKIANELEVETVNIKTETAGLEKSKASAMFLSADLTTLCDALSHLLAECLSMKGADFATLDEACKERLGVIVNHARSLSRMVNNANV